MIVNKLMVKCNYSSRKGVVPKFIVVHDTGNVNKTATAYNHYRYFAGKRRASAHYFVDETQVVQIIEDCMASWHCGDGKGKYGITNQNSIGVEMCVNAGANFDKTLERTVELVKYLMDTYNIPAARVVRHYDASKKMCPYSLSYNNWEGWDKFKRRIEG